MAFSGFCFGPFLKSFTALSDDRIRWLLQKLQGKTEWIRTYGTDGDQAKIPRIAKQLGFKVLAGAWIDSDNAKNEKEIAILAENVRNGLVDIAIVGNEVVSRGDLSAGALLHFVRKFQDMIGRKVPVTTADTLDVLKRHGDIISTCDVVMVHLYPYWAGISIDQSIDEMQRWYNETKSISQGKQVIIGESGWPTAGPSKGGAICNGSIAARYAKSIKSWARNVGVLLCYFEAFDEEWKQEEGVGAHWGIFNSNGDLKNEFHDLFSDAAPPVVIGNSFKLRSFHGTYLRAHPGNDALVDLTSNADTWETWTIVNQNLRSFHGTNLRAYPGDGGKVDVTTTSQEWENWIVVKNHDGTVYLRSAKHGSHLRAHSNGGKVDVSNYCDTWEKWRMI